MHLRKTWSSDALPLNCRRHAAKACDASANAAKSATAAAMPAAGTLPGRPSRRSCYVATALTCAAASTSVTSILQHLRRYARRRCCDGNCPPCEEVWYRACQLAPYVLWPCCDCTFTISGNDGIVLPLQECGRLLKCGNHRCRSRCHASACLPCTRELRVACACGATSYRLPCGCAISPAYTRSV